MVKKYLLYLGRWQLSGLILAPVIAWIGEPVLAAVLGNLIGGLIFFWLDMKLFNNRGSENGK